MSLRDRITELNDVFFDTDRIGESITFIPASNYANRQTVTAMVDRDALPGTNENPGDGRTLNKPIGRRDRQSVLVALTAAVASSIGIRDEQPERDPDLFEFDDSIWAVKRKLGEDAAIIDYLVVKTTVISRKRTEIVG